MRQITVNVNCKKGKLNRYFQRCIGAGRAAEVMRYTAFEQLKQIQKDIGFEYIRFHGLFHEEMGIVQRMPGGKLLFNFQYVDLLFDSLLEIGLRPVVELGLMPDTMGEEKKYVFWWKMNISMPKDMSEWESLVEALVSHLTHRYGEEEIKKWYFEVWNEPNHRGFFTKSTEIDQYFALYAAAAKAVKSVCQEYRVGGPATASVGWVPEMIAYCEENHVPLDFVSSHNYPGKVAFDPDGTRQVYMNSLDELTDGFCEKGKYCHDRGYPFLITEWSASASPRDSVHDSYFSAPLILRSIKACEGDVDMFSYWAYTDIFEEPGVPMTPFHGGFGLLNIQSLPKPSYHAYTFLRRLGDQELVCEDTDTYACKDAEETQILFWNYVHPENQDAPNKDYFARPLPSTKIEDANIVLEGLVANTEYIITRETIGYRSGDVYNAYLESNFTELPTREETKALIEKTKPTKVTNHVLSDENGVLQITVPQHENEVHLLTVVQK